MRSFCMYCFGNVIIISDLVWRVLDAVLRFGDIYTKQTLTPENSR